MLTVQLAQAFGRFSDTPVVPVPQLDTNVLSIGSTLSQVESNLKSAFNALQIAGVAAPNQPIAPEIISAYTTTRAAFAAAVQPWIDAYNQTPIDQRNPNDPHAIPVLPPDIGVLTSGGGFAGFSAAALPRKAILPSQLTVKYGPIGREKTSGLAASYYDPSFAYTYANAGLGIEPITTGILILVGILLVGAVIITVTALLTKESDAAKIARADADRQAAVSAAAVNALTTRKNLILECVNKSADPKVVAACTQAADQGAIDTLKNLPQIVPSAPGTGTVLSTIGIIAILGVIAGGGYLLYRHGQRAADRLPRATARSRRYASDDDGGWGEW